ncbi:DNA mismatch endonuclease Vsr [Lysobacter enzymogenes]|nr:very short patch repair endonuclease [Lysobacter enzymogenes]QCW28122.1 DNA mismatch endonuclease Vsr [Lysobacter enzymogenes]
MYKSDFKNVTAQTRRRMRAISAKNTDVELRVRRLLHSLGFRYRLHVKKMPGSPDIVLRRYKTVIFVHGCFWHGHESCLRASLPKNNAPLWAEKIKRNKLRDGRNQYVLKQSGWRVLVIWGCQTKLLGDMRKILLDFFGVK